MSEKGEQNLEGRIEEEKAEDIIYNKFVRLMQIRKYDLSDTEVVYARKLASELVQKYPLEEENDLSTINVFNELVERVFFDLYGVDIVELGKRYGDEKAFKIIQEKYRPEQEML